jgi:D-serine deaminase-like pyridoxal phosphate-dependent protein
MILITVPRRQLRDRCPRPPLRKKAVTITWRSWGTHDQQAMIFHDGRVHWPLTRTTGGPLVPVQLRDMRHEPVISEFGDLRLRRRPEHLGLGDAPPGHPVKAQLIRFIQARSVRELSRRRAEAIRMIEATTSLEFVNGGGTGSLESTAGDSSVTELTAGSGLVGPTLFDAYTRFSPEPALLFALPVVRRPGPGIATLFAGGYVASGTGTADRLPRPYLPAGLSLTGVEGAGEVQTPVRGAAAGSLTPGDRVWLRHAKAGELAERFPEYQVLDSDGQVTAVPTYRGEGQCFG